MQREGVAAIRSSVSTGRFVVASWTAAAAFFSMRYSLYGVNGFSVGHSSRYSVHSNSALSKTTLFSLQGNGEDKEFLNNLRSLLEASWDADTMGQVPSDPTIAANEAFSSILSAADQGISICFVDLLLPAYDIKQGSNYYDEVLGVEFCIALAECFQGKSSILVRDDKTVDVVSRTLNRREQKRKALEPKNIVDENYAFKEEDNDGRDDDASETEEPEEDDLGEAPSSPSTSDFNAFRQQLMASWGDDLTSKDDKSEDPTSSSSTNQQDKNDKLPKTSVSSKPVDNKKRYRLASLFGNAKISAGADMIEQTVAAVRVNALPQDDEETMIVLSANDLDEMVAVRSLASTYYEKKKMILVNCKLNPIPKELYGAETVYSLMPLIARSKSDDPQKPVPDTDETPPKVAVLRRYPGEWQCFVDANGSGFKLARSAPTNFSNQRGPPLPWIQQAVQDYMRTFSSF